MSTFTSLVVSTLILLQLSSTLFNSSQFKLAHANELCTPSSSSSNDGKVVNVSSVEKGMMRLYPLIDGERVKMEMNETRRKLGSFRICAPCTCCGAKGYCLPSPCCYAINCNIPNRPFGFCSFTPRTCHCFGCHHL